MSDDRSGFEEAVELLKDTYENRMPYNVFLGLEVVAIGREGVTVKVKMKEGLIGNFVRGMLHGGVISSLVDIVGGITSAVEVIKKMEGMPKKEIFRRIEKVSTVDLRVDYLRPGLGAYFLCAGTTVRMGGKVATIEMELTNDGGETIAVGRGTYLVG
jgi:uncharacterized protein (TIGR00369 family)